MNAGFFYRLRRAVIWPALLVWLTCRFEVRANPTGGTVSPVQATITGQGTPTVNINQTAGSAWINWNTFNVGVGETVNFNQPSANSIAWNQINDANPSQILGNINANGYVVLQNANGFVVGGSAVMNVHGLVMTTASTPPVNFGAGGPWSFDTPPPAAKIENYGQINITGGGTAYLIASDIVNEKGGAINAPNGHVGLYDGETVLVSMSPNGQGLNAQVTLPQGSVDNEGKLTANGGSVVAQAQFVNQNGIIQADTAANVNGTIELLGSSSVTLGANSTISAAGDSTASSPSAGGLVQIQSGSSFSDASGSSIKVSGASQGGNAGAVSITAPQMIALNSAINGQAAAGYLNGTLTIDTADIALNSDGSPVAGSLALDVAALSSGLSQINLEANNNITLNTGWNNLAANLSLTAGNSITLNNSADIQAVNGWNVNLTAGTANSGITLPAPGSDGIYLDGGAYLQTQSGDINLWAANEVIVNSGAIRTLGGGNIGVTAEFGNINTGSSEYGFNYTKTAPYETVSSTLGGISTADGGNVNINAGDNVISFSATTVAPPTQSGGGDPDPGTGCFGAASGNLTINAGGNVYGCFVVMNGNGTINAQNIGTSANNVALSLSTGGWSLNAQNSIYLQEVRNPNGLFNITTVSTINHNPSAANHLFTYSPQASLTLTAANAVYLTGFDLPRMTDAGVPMMLPPIVNVNAGPGGVVLDTPNAVDSSGNAVTLSDSDVTLFPSLYQGLGITIMGGGWLSSGNTDGTTTTLLMSDSGYTQWFNAVSLGLSIEPFGEDDHASAPLELNNDNPVIINLNGSQIVSGVPVAAGMENLTLQTDKATQINVAGDMIGCSFYGENLHASDVTSINVGGQIFNAGSFTSIALALDLPTLPADDIPLLSELPAGVSLNSWYLALALSVNPNADLLKQSFAGLTLSQMLSDISSSAAFQSLDFSGITYDPGAKTLTAIGPLSANLLSVLESPTLTVVRFGADGYPVLDANGHPVLDTISWTPATSANAALIATLYTQSQNSVPLGPGSGAYVVGGAGQFNVSAGSISLGNSYGILSIGDDDSAPGGRNYSFLAPYFTSAADIDVTAGYLEMPASTIACLSSGGSVKVTATGEIPNSALNNNGVGVSMDLGSAALAGFESQIMNVKNLGLGVYTTGGGDVDLLALGSIDIDSSRVATFDGGNISVKSSTGDVDAGSGGSVSIPISYYAPNYFGTDLEFVSANGVVAATLTGGSGTPPGAVLLPGNITVNTPQGSIYTSAGGISQVAYNEVLSASSGSAAINLDAGSAGYIGNLDLGDAGVFGINVDATATGNITGKIFSVQNAIINANGSFAGTIFSGGKTTINTGGGSSGDFVAVEGIGGVGNLTGTIISTSVNGGAGTVATATTASTATQSAANQTSAQNQQQVTSNIGDTNNDKDKKKKEQLRTVGRVTVLLAGAVPK
jgi:filamentous hemagglutinin family protein